MSGYSPSIHQLGEALAAFRATRSPYQSSSDQAQTDLLVALSETVLALGSGDPAGAAATQLAVLVEQFRATRPSYQSSSDQALSDLVALLGDQVVVLRARQGSQTAAAPAAASQPLIGELQGQIDILQMTLRTQESEIRQLRNQLGGWRSPPAKPAVEAPPRVMRPTEYWAENMPDFGDNLTPEQARQHLASRRVRPEEVVLTAEEIARNTRRKPQPDLSPNALRVLVIGMMIVVMVGWMILIGLW